MKEEIEEIKIDPCLVAAIQSGRWRPVGRALPIEDTIVMTKRETLREITVQQALKVRAGKWCFPYGSRLYYVPTHWRPLDDTEKKQLVLELADTVAQASKHIQELLIELSESEKTCADLSQE